MGAVFGFPSVSPQTLYASGGQTLFAIDVTAGEINWEREFENGIGAPIADDGTLFLEMATEGSRTNVLSALDVER